MKEWGFAQTDKSQQLAQLHYFTITKQHAAGEVEFLITVKEYLTPKEPMMGFFAQADKEINQKVAPYRPSGDTRARLGTPLSGSEWRTRKSCPNTCAANVVITPRLAARQRPTPFAKWTRSQRSSVR